MRSEPPMEGCEKIEQQRLGDGRPDGQHCGAWIVYDRVWKSLLCRPFANSDILVPSGEEKVLEELAGRPFFPKNWSVQYSDDNRPWLVRPRAKILGRDLKKSVFDRHIEKLEDAVYQLNMDGWEINDEIQLGHDGKEWFIVDMSAAQRMRGYGTYAADDSWQFLGLLEYLGFNWLKALRVKGKHVAVNYAWNPVNWAHDEENFSINVDHVYASFNRPLGSWAKLPKSTHVIHEDSPSWADSMPHSWVLSVGPIDDSIVNGIELKLAWRRHGRQHPVETTKVEAQYPI